MRRPGHVPTPVGLDACHALLDYEGDARRLVSGIKYRNDRRALSWLAEGMVALMCPPDGCVVTWAPTSLPRRRRRGFDQAELLAKAVARRWSVSCKPLLQREGGEVQTGRCRRDRLGGVTFRLRYRRPISHPIVVVDDVLTTGATLAGAAQVLRAAGAPWVGALAAAYTPPHVVEAHRRA